MTAKEQVEPQLGIQLRTVIVPWGLQWTWWIPERTWCHRRGWSGKQVLLISWQIVLLLAVCWIDLLALQGTLKSLCQHHSSKASRRSNQSVLEEINPEYSLEGLMLKLQCSVQLMWTTDSLWKDPDSGKDWGLEEKGVTEDEMVGWHHWLDGQESEPTPGDDEGQGSLACCSPLGCDELDTAWWLHNHLSASMA